MIRRLRLDPGRPKPAGAGWRFHCTIPADSPAFAGHFPGRPVLPAIGQLALLEAACRRALGAGTLAGLELMRLQQPLGPGDPLEIRLERPDDQGCVRFALKSGRRAVSAGTLQWERARR